MLQGLPRWIGYKDNPGAVLQDDFFVDFRADFS